MEKKKTEKRKGLFKSSEKPDETEKAPSLEEQLQDLEEKLAANAEESQITQGQLSQVRENIDSDGRFLETEIRRLRKEHTGGAKGFLDKLLKLRHPSTAQVEATKNKLEANLRVLVQERRELRKQAEAVRKLISETADRELAGEIIDNFESLINRLKEDYQIWQKLKNLRRQIDGSTLVYHIDKSYKKPGIYAHILTSRMKTEYLSRFSLGSFFQACMELNLDTVDGKPLIEVDYGEYVSSRHYTDDGFLVGDEPPIVRKAV